MRSTARYSTPTCDCGGESASERPAGQALTAAERVAVLDLINTTPYADLSIGQIWTRELDEGRYLCSMSTMYRIARAAGQSRERRRQATHPAKVKPELCANGPSQVWSWDITKLRGPTKGVFYHLYVLIDIYSRYNPGWIVSTVEESHLAADFLADAIARNGVAPHTVHADRGTSMTSKPVSALLTDLGVTRTHSRPRVSNDNPYSESQYRTLKYLPDFPDHFNSLAHAKQFLTEFFYQYNYIHRHSGVGWHTPSSVHFGTAAAILRRLRLPIPWNCQSLGAVVRGHLPMRPKVARPQHPDPRYIGWERVLTQPVTTAPILSATTCPSRVYVKFLC